MKNTIRIGLTFATLPLLALGLLAAPQAASAQQKPDNPDSIPAEKRMISLDLENTDLYAAFTLLFKQAKVNYTLDSSLKGTTVTAHIKLPLRQAIDTLLKISGSSVTLLVENNVYSIVPQSPDSIKVPEPAEEVSTAVEETPGAQGRVGRVAIRNLNSLDIGAMLGIKFYLYTSSLIYHGQNPYAPVPFGSPAGGVPGAPGGAAGSGAAGTGNNGGNDVASGKSGSGAAGSLLTGPITLDDLFAFDMDTTALLALYRGL